ILVCVLVMTGTVWCTQSETGENDERYEKENSGNGPSSSDTDQAGVIGKRGIQSYGYGHNHHHNHHGLGHSYSYALPLHHSGK
ncbi:unnamed protein product, partial [Allacma fusca]